MLAQVRPIGTRTSLFNLGGLGKQPLVPVSDNAEDRAREAALEQFDQESIFPAHSSLMACQRDSSRGTDGEVNFVERGTHHFGGDLAWSNLKIDHRATPNVGAPARKAILVVAKRFEMGTPCLAPKRARNVAALDLDRRAFGPL